MRDNILITGEIKSGKSTLIDMLLQRIGLKPLGFRTLPYFEEGKRVGFYMIAADEEPFQDKNVQESHLIGRIVGYKKIDSCVQTFNDYGVKLMQKAVSSDRIILMDELGIIENDAIEFQEMVMKCLDSESIVIASIRDDHSPFLDQVRAHKRAHLYTVDASNKDHLIEEILKNHEILNELLAI